VPHIDRITTIRARDNTTTNGLSILQLKQGKVANNREGSRTASLSLEKDFTKK
jgi:hypothetical protein